jgi:hypothetical protein
MMAFGRYLKVSLDGFYVRALDGSLYEWAAFAAPLTAGTWPGTTGARRG